MQEPARLYPKIEEEECSFDDVLSPIMKPIELIFKWFIIIGGVFFLILLLG